MRNKRILVYGFFGYANNQLDGQTIKTRAIYELLKERYNGDVEYFDCEVLHRNKASILLFLKKLTFCDVIFFIGAGNNIRQLFPWVYRYSKLLRFKIVFVAVGGWLNEELIKHPAICKKMQRVHGILVQNKLQETELLTDCDIPFAQKIPNFRNESPVRPLPTSVPGKLRLVYMARIHKMKGLDSIKVLAEYILQNGFDSIVSIDFYGQINPDDEEYFITQLVEPYDFITYHGALAPDEIKKTLVNYDVMLLPTHYYTEGFPGTVLDAYRAGLPVIVTKWKFATEFVNDGVSGYIIPFENCEADLCATVKKLIDNPDCLAQLKEGTYQTSLDYTPDKAWEVIEPYIK